MITRYSNPTNRNYPSPNKLPEELRPMWAASFENALDYYGGQNLEGTRGDLENTASATAWKALNVAYPELVFQNPLPTMKRLPDPGAVVLLGKTVELVVIADPPTLDIYRFPEPLPDLLWSDRHKMLIVLPNDHIDTSRIPCVDEVCEAASERFQEWSRRAARGHTNVTVPAYPVVPIGVGDSVVYRSDKWGPYANNGPKTQQYIHQFGDRVWILADTGWQRDDELPDLMMAQGGELEMRREGIVN